jgi:UvrD-like helicase family protein
MTRKARRANSVGRGLNCGPGVNRRPPTYSGAVSFPGSDTPLEEGERVAAGQVEPGGITVDHQTVGVGDEIVTTRNDRRLVTTSGAWVRNGDRWQIRHRSRNGSVQAVSMDGRGTVTLPSDYVTDNVALAYAVTVHKAQGITVDGAVLVVDLATTAEHLYVGMTRGRHHNQACIVTEAAGDEHTRREPPAAEVLAGALRKTSNEKSATETLRNDLDQHSHSTGRHAAILEGLRQTHAHSLNQTIRTESRRHALIAVPPSRRPRPPSNEASSSEAPAGILRSQSVLAVQADTAPRAVALARLARRVELFMLSADGTLWSRGQPCRAEP